MRTSNKKIASARFIASGYPPPDSLSLPEGWQHFYGTRKAGVLRCGIKGQHYDDSYRAFDASQSAELGVNRNGNVS